MPPIETLLRGLQAEVALLHAAHQVLKTLIDSLTSENKALTAEHTSLVARLTAEIKALREENAKLQAKLGLTSKNSSIPSSKELYKLKRNQAVPSLRSIGGQPGHPGTTRGKMVSDEVIDLPISEVCHYCKGHVVVSTQPYIHQKVDLPEIKPYVVTYHVQHGRCKECGKR